MSPSLARRALAALVALTALLLAAAGPAAASPDLRGVNTHSVRSGLTSTDADRELNLIRAAGGNTVRFDIGWAALEEAGKGRWSSTLVARIDRAMSAAAQRGLRVVVTFVSTPCWASSAPETIRQGCSAGWWSRGAARYPPRDPRDYADAVEYVLRRWGSRMTALEVWNEPNTSATWVSADPAGDYVRLLAPAYTRAKRVDRRVSILAGAIAGSDTGFLERLYAAGLKNRHDGVSVHPYTNQEPDLVLPGQDLTRSYVLGVPRMGAIIDAHGEGGDGLWLTEAGFSTCTNLAICVSEADQAHHVNELFRIAEGWWYVRALLVYDLRDDGSDPANKEHRFGLVRRDFSAKPAYAAFADAMAGRYVR